MLQPGDYDLNFEFTLPEDLPATILFKEKKHRDKPKAKLLHTVKAILHTQDQKQMMYKQLIVVHEPPVEFEA